MPSKHKLGNIFDGFDRETGFPLAKKTSDTELFLREYLDLKGYVAQRTAGITNLKKKIEIYKKLIKKLKKNKKAKKIFEEDIGSMKQAISTLENELKDITVKLDAIDKVTEQEHKKQDALEEGLAGYLE